MPRLPLPLPALIRHPLATRRIPLPIDVVSVARRVGLWPVESSRRTLAAPQHHPALLHSRKLPRDPKGRSIPGTLRKPQNFQKHSPPSPRTGNPPMNLDPGVGVGAVAAEAEAPELPENVVVPSERRETPRTIASPSLPVNGSHHPEAVRQGPGMEWSNPNESIGKMNWNRRKNRWPANLREPSGRFLRGPMPLPSSSRGIWKTIAKPQQAAVAVLALALAMGRDRTVRKMEVVVVPNHRVPNHRVPNHRVRTIGTMTGRHEPQLPGTKSQGAVARDQMLTAMNHHPAPIALAPRTIAHPKGEDATTDRVHPADVHLGIRHRPSHRSTESKNAVGVDTNYCSWYLTNHRSLRRWSSGRHVPPVRGSRKDDARTWSGLNCSSHKRLSSVREPLTGGGRQAIPSSRINYLSSPRLEALFFPLGFSHLGGQPLRSLTSANWIRRRSPFRYTVGRSLARSFLRHLRTFTIS